MENYTQAQQSNLFTPEQIKQFSNYLNSDAHKNYISYQMKKDFDEKIESITPSHNLINETNELLEQQNIKVDNLTAELKEANTEIKQQTEKLQAINNENIKLNGQIEMLNNIIYSQKSELMELHNINFKLGETNKTLEKNNKHATLKGIIIGVITGLLVEFIIRVVFDFISL